MTPTFRIFISSPGDVGRERAIAERVLARVEARFGGRLRVDGYFWEHAPMTATHGDFQTQIPTPDAFDLVICVLWSRLGTRLNPNFPTRADGTEYSSGTEYEFECAARAYREHGTPELLVYRRSQMPLFPAEPEEDVARRTRQWQALKLFCERWFFDSTQGFFKAAYHSYRDADEFQVKLETHLGSLIRKWLERRGAVAPASRYDHVPTWLHESPYRGLSTFQFEHEPIFFGRTRARDDVLGILQARLIEENCPFLIVLGASGSGKSSLLRAGVLPWLVRPGVIEGVGLWRRLLWRPSEGTGTLLEGLARSLVAPDALPELLADGTTAEAIAKLLQDAPVAIVGLIKGALSQAAAAEKQVANLAMQPVARLALGIDQVEEIFTLEERFSREDRAALFQAVALLTRAGYAWTVVTMRSDFYSRCEEIPALVALTQGRGQYRLLPPTGPEVGQMIRYPADAAGVTFEDSPDKGKLDDVIRDAALAHIGALPLLEYVLDELYRLGSKDSILLHEQYEGIGGLEGALARRAEETYNGLSDAGRSSFSVVAGALVRVNEGGRGTRQPAALESVAVEPGAREFISEFVAARLFVTDSSETLQATVSVAHEALLTAWHRLATWIRDNSALLQSRSRLEQSANVWEAKGRHVGFLLSPGIALEEAEDVLRRDQTALSTSARTFVHASVIAAADAAAEKTRERRRDAIRRHADADFLWADFKATGFQQSDVWRFARLAEIESGLVNALALDPDLAAAETLLIGIRRLVVETAIATRDLNLAAIYIQKLKLMERVATVPLPALETELETAWKATDPTRNTFVIRRHHWAIAASCLQVLWLVAGSVALGLTKSRWLVYVVISAAATTALVFVMLVFAIMTSLGRERALGKTTAFAFMSFFSACVGLNPVAAIAICGVIYYGDKIRMARLLWPTPRDPVSTGGYTL